MGNIVLRVTNILLCVAALGTAVVTVVGIFLPPVQMRQEVYLALFLTISAAILGYMIRHSESVDKRLEQLASRAAAVEVYRSIDEWAARITAITPQSHRVSTQMFSDAPQRVARSYEKYFKETHRALKDGKIRSFRRIASTGNATKVRWLLATLADLSSVEGFSLAVADIAHDSTPLTALHVCETPAAVYTFVFSTVPASGVMNAFMVENRDVGASVCQTYDVLWERARKLKEGNRIHFDAVAELAAAYDLTDSPEYARVRALAD